MRSVFAALRTLVLPYGATAGKRIILDGVNGLIAVYDLTKKILQIDSDGLHVTGSTGTIDLVVDTLNNFAKVVFSDPTLATTPAQVAAHPGVNGAETITMNSGVGTDTTQGSVTIVNNGVYMEVIKNSPFAETGVLVDLGRIRVRGGFFESEGEVYTDVGLLNAWVNRAGWNHLAYKKDSNGRVFLRGSISGGTSASGTKIGTIPAGYRPATHDAVGSIVSDNIPAAYAAANGSCRLQVQLGGDMFIYGTGAGPLYFDGFSWDTKD